MTVGPVSSTRPTNYTPSADSPSRYRAAPSFSQAEAGNALRIGQQGPAVQELQQRLNAAGAQPPLDTDGKFGPNTDAAVRSFQQLNQLQVDGKAGPQTIGGLKSGASFESPEVTRARTDARTTVGNTQPENRPPAADLQPSRTVNVASGLQNQPDPNSTQGRMDQLLQNNPQIRTNQDFINHCYRESNNTWAGASETASRYGKDLNQLVQHRSDAIQTGANAVERNQPTNTNGQPNGSAPTTGANPVTNPNATGAQLETFPVAGGRYNIGYDGQWNNFDANTARHNSDYSRSATNSSHPNGHLGVDIFAPKGQPVVSPVSGTVENVGNTTVGGNCVTIRRGNERFYMAHLDSLANLRPGQTINAGDPVGTVGNTGSARGTAPHVHFSIYQGQGGYSSGSVNPFPYLDAARQ
ncbi:MAG: peptidoglycan DD-metalloendopeptidase family protein [Pseudomonadota bacterium]